MLLLIGPILIIVRSIATHRCSRASTPITPSDDSPSLSQQDGEMSQSSPDDMILSVTHSSFSNESNSSENDQLKPSNLRVPKKSYLIRFWAGPCILLCWLSLFLIAVYVLQVIIDRSGGSKHVPRWPIFTLLVSDFRPLPYILIFHPTMCHLGILAGMALENTEFLKGCSLA